MTTGKARRIDDRRRGRLRPHVGEFDAGWASGKKTSDVQALIPEPKSPHGPRSSQQAH
jgi:hypothetical protein